MARQLRSGTTWTAACSLWEPAQTCGLPARYAAAQPKCTGRRQPARRLTPCFLQRASTRQACATRENTAVMDNLLQMIENAKDVEALVYLMPSLWLMARSDHNREYLVGPRALPEPSR